MTHDAVPSPLPTPIITQYVSAKEVAAQLHIGVRKARQMLRHDLGPGVRFGDRTERWPAAAVQALIERQFVLQDDPAPESIFGTRGFVSFWIESMMKNDALLEMDKESR